MSKSITSDNLQKALDKALYAQTIVLSKQIENVTIDLSEQLTDALTHIDARFDRLEAIVGNH